MLRETKKGVSPLIATVLLISFAVALGLLVMEIANKIVENADTAASCKDARITVTDVCYTDGKIRMSILNGDKTRVDGIKMIVESVSKFYNVDEILERQMQPGDGTKLFVPYDLASYGSINSIRYIIKIKRDENSGPELCSRDDYPNAEAVVAHPSMVCS